jgi:4'-phosphopantetheinyl transferase
MNATEWPLRCPESTPPEGEVHLWFSTLDLPGEQLRACEQTLSPSERSLVDRKVTDELRRRAVASRGLLRQALGRTLGRDPSAVSISIGEHGKPHLADRADALRLDFNLSHTGEFWLLALATIGPVGVDIETPRDETDWDALVERYFSPAEGAAFRALPRERRKEAFFRVWTQKEAFLKARGSGLTTPLAAFDVEVDPDEPVALRASRLDTGHSTTWWITEIEGLEVPGMVAGRGPKPILRCSKLGSR